MIYHISIQYFNSLRSALSNKSYRATGADVLGYLNKMAGVKDGIKELKVT